MRQEEHKKTATALLARLALFFLPVGLYFTVFIFAEPYNYFGLQDNATESDQVIYRVRQFVNAPQDAVIFGDSRLAHLDMQQINELSGRSFANLAFGGAAQAEMIDLCEFAIEQNPCIDTVYMEVSFYTLNARYDKNRASNIETVVTRPLAYLFNFDYNLEMLNRLRLLAQGVDLGAEHETAIDPLTGKLTYTQADYTDEDGTPLPYRRQLLTYNDTLRPICQNYQLNLEVLQRLKDLATLCAAREIQLTFVLPPMADSVYNEIVVGFHIEKELNIIVEALRATGARVIDLEYSGRPAWDESLFFDGFHLDTVAGLPLLAEIVFS